MSRFRSKNAYGQWSHPRGKGGKFVGKGLGTGTKLAAKIGIKTGKYKEYQKRQKINASARAKRSEKREAGELDRLINYEARDLGLKGAHREAYRSAVKTKGGDGGRSIILNHGKPSARKRAAKMSGSKL